jgi:hypothetical protein
MKALAITIIMSMGGIGCSTGKVLKDTLESTSEIQPVIDRQWDINEKDRRLLIVMVHGFNSSSDQAWGEFPNLIKAQKHGDFANFNVVRYGYGSSMCRNRVGIAERGAGLKSFLKDEISKYEGAIFVSHSMGGLVTMYSLMGLAQENNKDLSRLPITVMTFGTPYHGVKAADVLGNLASLCSDPQADDLRVFNDSSRDRNIEWNSYFGTEANSRYHYRVNVKAYYGESDFLVEPVSACGPFLGCDQVDGNHVMMVKPSGTEHLTYKKVLSAIRGLMGELPGPAAPINLRIQ